MMDCTDIRSVHMYQWHANWNTHDIHMYSDDVMKLVHKPVLSGLVRRAQPLHKSSEGSGDSNIHNLWSWNAAKTSRIHILCVLPDWKHWNLPLCHVSSSKHYFNRCTSVVEHSRPRLHAAFLRYLLAQVFWIAQFMLIHVAIRSTLFYTSPRFLGKDTSHGSPDPSEFSWRGCTCQTTLWPWHMFVHWSVTPPCFNMWHSNKYCFWGKLFHPTQKSWYLVPWCALGLSWGITGVSQALQSSHS
jgi:hypothetical protein